MSKIQIKVKCSNCGYIPKPNKKMSNKNWDVFDTKCSKCGGKIELKFNTREEPDAKEIIKQYPQWKKEIGIGKPHNKL